MTMEMQISKYLIQQNDAIGLTNIRRSDSFLMLMGHIGNWELMACWWAVSWSVYSGELLDDL